MAASAVGGLTAFQKVGEGLFETLTRLARDYQVVDVALQSIGKSFGMVGAESVGARENLIGLFGGLDAFADQTGYFRENFLSEAEQMAPVIAAVTAEMARLGLSSTDTKDEFKQVVLGLDLSSEAGQGTFAALMAVAPAFAKVAAYTASLTGELQDAAQSVQDLAQIAKQRRSLEIQLMEAQGRSEEALAAKRADELAALDPTLRALQEQVWAAQAAADANKALAQAQEEAARLAQAIADKRRDLEIQLMEATGNAAGALAARRADELAALDPLLRSLQAEVWAAQDAAQANQGLADVQSTAAEIARTRRELEIRLMEAEGNAAGALAAKRADELAALDPVLRALQEQVWAAEDAAEANQALANIQATAAEIARTRRELEIRLMEAEGNAAGALAAKRADELAALDPVLRALQEQVWAAEDAAEANQALANVQATAAEIARTRRELEIRLMEAEGNAAGALAAKRADELAALDPTLRALLQQIYAAEDATAANQALADAQSAAAQAAEEAAQQAAELAKQRSGLEIDLLRALGRETEAVAAERALQLAGLDASLSGLQQQVWAAQDAAAAQQALADAQTEAAKAAEDAAAAQQALADKRADLEIALLRATGNEIGAVAMERQRELAQLDPTLRALQEQVWAAEDAKGAYSDQTSALKDTVDRFGALAQSLRDYRLSLAGAAAGSTEGAYLAASGRFGAVYQRARMGDAGALGDLEAAGQSFLEASRANAGSMLEFQRDVGFVASAVGEAIGIADAQVSDADRQLAALDQHSELLAMINGSVGTVHDAIMLAAERGTPVAVPSSAYVSTPQAAPSGEVDELKNEVRLLREEIGAPIKATAVRVAKIDDRQSRWDDAGSLAVSTRDETLSVEVV
jgi:hypothetical protein